MCVLLINGPGVVFEWHRVYSIDSKCCAMYKCAYSNPISISANSAGGGGQAHRVPHVGGHRGGQAGVDQVPHTVDQPQSVLRHSRAAQEEGAGQELIMIIDSSTRARNINAGAHYIHTHSPLYPSISTASRSILNSHKYPHTHIPRYQNNIIDRVQPNPSTPLPSNSHPLPMPMQHNSTQSRDGLLHSCTYYYLEQIGQNTQRTQHTRTL